MAVELPGSLVVEIQAPKVLNCSCMLYCNLYLWAKCEGQSLGALAGAAGAAGPTNDTHV